MANQNKERFTGFGIWYLVFYTLLGIKLQYELLIHRTETTINENSNQSIFEVA